VGRGDQVGRGAVPPLVGDGLVGVRLKGLAALGPFFAVEAHEPERQPASGWRALSDVVDDRGLLQARVDAVRAYLAFDRPADAVELRVAGSIAHLGLTARLLSPMLALAALFDVDHPVRLSDVRCRDELGGAFPLSLPRTLLDAAPAPHADWSDWAAALVDGPLAQVSEALADVVRSERIRSGNVASAVNGAVAVLAAAAPGGAASSRARALLDHPALRRASSGQVGTAGFRRCSCCLLYRATPGGSEGPEHGRDRATARALQLCGDCVLVKRD
jgi:hypothetical protein